MVPVPVPVLRFLVETRQSDSSDSWWLKMICLRVGTKVWMEESAVCLLWSRQSCWCCLCDDCCVGCG